MAGHDHDRMAQWLDEALDGGLEPSQRQQLEAHVQECDSCRHERDLGKRLHQLLADDRILVEEGFVARVMRSLTPAPWEIRPARAWRLALALLAVFAVGSALLLAGSGLSGSAPLGIVATLGDFFGTALLAGAGLLGASWRGIGLALQEVLTGSPFTLVAFAGSVVALNILAWRLLRSRSPSAAATRSVESGD